jgi:hypothetical protein
VSTAPWLLPSSLNTPPTSRYDDVPLCDFAFPVFQPNKIRRQSPDQRAARFSCPLWKNYAPHFGPQHLGCVKLG